jgi:exosortase
VRKHFYFTVLIIIGVLIYFSPIESIAKLAFENETYSHLTLIPAISAFFLFVQRRAIFENISGNLAVGLTICCGGLVLYALAHVFHEGLDSPAFRNQDVSNDYLTLCMLGAVAWAIGSFIGVYGLPAFQEARFAMLFLIFMVPLPMFLLNGVIKVLQLASAEAADLVFKVIGVSYLRNDLVFEFSNVSVLVAEQCSGIRSSLSLFILSIITGYLFLKSFSRRVILSLAILPITVVKNAFRIVTVTLLANFVDMRFISNHWIHSSGGIPFFAVALAMFIPLVWVLRKTEKK